MTTMAAKSTSGYTEDGATPEPRRRDADATRAAIEEAARTVFAEQGYDAARTREIAALAGVNVALLARYFGGKEGLFVAAVLPTLRIDALLDGPIAELPDRVAAAKRLPSSQGYDPALATARSILSEVAGPHVRAALRRQIVEPLAERLDGQNRIERAEMIGAAMLGFALVQRDERPQAAITALASTIRVLIDEGQR